MSHLTHRVLRRTHRASPDGSTEHKSCTERALNKSQLSLLNSVVHANKFWEGIANRSSGEGQGREINRRFPLSASHTSEVKSFDTRTCIGFIISKNKKDFPIWWHKSHQGSNCPGSINSSAPSSWFCTPPYTASLLRCSPGDLCVPLNLARGPVGRTGESSLLWTRGLY